MDNSEPIGQEAPKRKLNRYLDKEAQIISQCYTTKKDKPQPRKPRKTWKNPAGMKAKPTEVADMIVKLRTMSMKPECRDESGGVAWEKVAEQMGWTMDELNSFRETHGNLILCAQELMGLAPSTMDPSQEGAAPLVCAQDNKSRTGQQMRRAIATIEVNLLRGLRSVGLNLQEAQKVIARAAFNKVHFAESMDSISTSVMVMATKLMEHQERIEGRLAGVRKELEKYGYFDSDERTNLVKEEHGLMDQYVETGNLLNKIQESWYNGAAILAVMRARLRGEQNVNGRVGLQLRTQRSNKPGFRPSIIINGEGEQVADNNGEAPPP